jgi:hypothetical protein
MNMPHATTPTLETIIDLAQTSPVAHVRHAIDAHGKSFLTQVLELPGQTELSLATYPHGTDNHEVRPFDTFAQQWLLDGLERYNLSQ